MRYQGFERGKSAGGSGGAPATRRRGEAAGEEKVSARTKREREREREASPLAPPPSESLLSRAGSPSDPSLFSSSSSPLSCRAARGTYNTDFASTLEYKRHDNDVGSPEYQIARLSTRIKQLTEHLKVHTTDHATRRGLMALLNQRNKLLKYLFRTDRPAYTSTIESLGIRSRLMDEL